MFTSRTGVALAGVPATFLPGALGAQVTTNQYARAEAFLPWNAVTLTSGTEVAPRWIGPDRFWFRGRRMDGFDFVLVDPAKLSRGPAFDHERLGNRM